MSLFVHVLHLALCLGTALASFSIPSTSQLVSNSTAPNTYGISPVSLANDGTYYVVLQTGEISFRAAIDTGSSRLFVGNSPHTKTCLSVPRYPLAYASPTFVNYADGTSASGFAAREAVEVSNVTALDQAFGMVTDSNITLNNQVSGVLGLGFPRLSEIYAATANATPFITSLSEQGVLDYPVFGLSLTRNSTGTLTLGAVDVSVLQNVSQIVWNDVVPFSPIGTQTNTSGYMYWAIHMTSFAVNGSELTPIPTYPGPTDNSSIALLDVGTPGLYGPYQDVTRLYALFPDSRLVDTSKQLFSHGQWAIPCDSSATMSFSFGPGDTFVLQPTDYLIGPTSGNPDLCLSWPKASPPSSDGVDWQLAPMIGLYPLINHQRLSSPRILYLRSSLLRLPTVATTLPNYVLATPTFSTPPYAFNTSVPATLGEVVPSELATSTYKPILVTPAIGATELPRVSDAYTLIDD
ncbi:aspartic peptidase domain-containing protein [Melanogaster broomeanus]|nr:aspartic peptidase domain-containing protein [Melanogaster broomeanus]